MSSSFLSPRQARLQNAVQQKQKKTFRLFAELLLEHDFPEHLCRELLNGRLLLSHENERAARLLSDAIPSFFETHSSPDHPEPVSLESIAFIYQFLSQTIPPKIQHLIGRILQQREDSLKRTIEEEKERLFKLQSNNNVEIDTLNQNLSRRYAFAFVLFVMIASGILVLFLGFYSMNYQQVLIGLLLIAPSLFITENPNGFVQFRRDQTQQNAVFSLQKQLKKQETHIALLQEQQNDIQFKRQQLEAELQSPNPD
ncbi:MAG: hypothetical protein VX278_10700 [Myxococcota bacterium]|nr:hypothetical protein [Myxococcota bacterium]